MTISASVSPAQGLASSKTSDSTSAFAPRFDLCGHGMGRDPNAILQVTKAPGVEISSEPRTSLVLGQGDIEEHEAPAPIPRARPMRNWIPSSESMKAAFARETIKAGAGGGRFFSLEKFLLLESRELSLEAVAIGPVFERPVEITESRPG